MADVVGIRRDVNPLAPAIEKVVGEALEALEQQLEQAKGLNDTVFAGYLSTMIVQTRAMKAMIDGITATVAAAGAVSDQQFAVLRGDFRRTTSTALLGWKDQFLSAAAWSVWAKIAGIITILSIVCVGAGFYLGHSSDFGRDCAVLNDGHKWCTNEGG